MKRWLNLGQLARMNLKERSRAGYSITELLIVLAVTTAMFAAVAVLFNGRQAAAEFTKSVRDYEAMLQTVISDVSSGYYYNASMTNCTVGSTGGPSFSGVGGGTGTNTNCIFVGKMIVPEPAMPASIESTIRTLVGRRYIENSSTTSDVTTLAQAMPMVATDSDQLRVHTFQLRVTRIEDNSNGASLGAFGFFNRFAAAGMTGNSTNVQLYAVDAPSDPGSSYPPGAGITIYLCGQRNQEAKITIGAGTAASTAVVSELNTGECVLP